MILLAIAITILCIGSVSAVEETNATLETVNEISQNENIVINEMTDETITNDDSKGESIVSDSNDKQNIENKEILKASDGEDVLNADVTGYIQIRETNSKTTGTFESVVGEEIGIDVYWRSLQGYQFQLLVNDKSVQSFYPSGWGDSWSDTLHYTPESPGTYTIMVICQGSSSRYVSNTLTWEVAGSAKTKTETSIEITPSTVAPDEEFTINYNVYELGTTTNVNVGTITFYDSDGQIGSSINLANPTTFRYSYSNKKLYNIYAKYAGNDDFSDSESSKSKLIVKDENDPDPTVTLKINNVYSQYDDAYWAFNEDYTFFGTYTNTADRYDVIVTFEVEYSNDITSATIEYGTTSISSKTFSGNNPTINFKSSMAGENTVKVIVDGIESNEVTVDVRSGSSYQTQSFSITPTSGNEGETITITPVVMSKSSYATGYSSVEVPGIVSIFSSNTYSAETLIATISTDGGSFTIPLIDTESEYEDVTYYIAFSGKYGNYYFYTPSSNSFNFRIYNVVESKDTTISLSPASYTITQGDSQIITPSVIDSDSQSVDVGTITYYDNDNPISGYTDVSISTTFDTSTLTAGTHNIKAKYNGGDGYNPSEFSTPVTVTVNQLVGFSISVTNSTYPTNAIATVIGEECKTYTITVTGTGKSFTVTIPAGQTRVTQDLGALAAGDNYEAKVTYNGETNTTTFNISKATPTLTISNIVGNNSLLSDSHSFTVNAQGSGKIETNITSQQFDIGDVITLTGLVSGSNKIKVTYLGDENYTQATQNITFVVYDKYPTEITLVLNETGIAKGDKIRATPTVNNGDLTTGEVAFYYEDGTLIDTINLSEKQYLEFTPQGDEGDTIKIYAKYVENTNYAESTNSNTVSVKIKKSFTITLTVSGDSVYRTGSYSNGPIYVFSASTEDNLNLPVQVLDDFTGYGSPILYDVSSGKTTDGQVGSFYFDSSEVGDHDIYVKFLGNDEYLASESNHIQFTVYESRTVSGIEFDPNYGIVGEEVTVTPSIYYQAGYSDKIYLNNGTLNLYSDSSKTNLIATVKLGQSFTYTVPEVTSSYYSYSTIYATFIGINDGYAYSTPVSSYSSYVSGYFYSMEENNLAIYGNDNIGTIQANPEDVITISIDLDNYYNQGNSNNPPIVKIYVDNEFKANVPTVYNSGYGTHSFSDYQLDLSTLTGGEHTVYAFYEGYHDGSRHYAEVDSNILTINILKTTTVTLTPENITVKQGESKTITPTVSDGTNTVTTGNITYYDNGNPIAGYIEVPVDTPFATTNLAIGNHKITAKYNGGNGYKAGDSNSVNVTVKSAVGFTISVTSPTYPDTAVATVTGESGKTYTITVTNTDKSFTVTIPEGETQITQNLGELAAGNNYEAIVTYDGENNNTNFDISKGNPNLSITVNGNDTLIGDAKNITVTALGNGKFTINDETAEHELSEIIDLTDLDQSATYTIHYKETDNYTSADKTVTISVLSAYKTSIVIELNENTITKGHSITVTPTVTDEKGNIVTKGIITFYNSADELIGTIDLEKNTTFTFNPIESDRVYAKYLDNESLKLTGNTSSAESFTVEKQKIQTIVTLELSTNELVTSSGQITITPHVIGANGEEVDAGSITIKDVSSLWDGSGQITRNINLGESTTIYAPYNGLDTSKNPYSLYVWYNGGEGSEYIFEDSKSTNPTYYYHVYYNNAAELKINDSVEFTAYVGDKITFYANLTGGSTIKLFKDGVESEIVLTPNTEYTLTLTENDLGDFKYYFEYAAGGDNYRYASAVSNDATLHVKSKTTPEITLNVNNTKINQGEKVKFNVTVKYDGAKIEEGQVAFYYDGESEAIEIINLAEKDYIELDTSSLTKGNTYTVNAKYLGYGAYGNVTSTNKEFKVKSTLPIIITVDGENEEDIEVSYSKSVTIAADCGDVTPELIILVDGVETSYKIREGYKTQSYTFYTSDKGQHNITVKFQGNDDYEESLSNNVTVNVYKRQAVRPTISFNVTDYAVEGQKVLITINTGDAPLNITLYRDSYANDEITHIEGETSTYEFTVDKTSGSEPNYNKYIYGSYDETVKDYVIYYGDGYYSDFSGYFKVARENHMNITLDNENVTLSVTYGDTVTIKALLDYYRSISSGEWYAPTYTSNITIYMDDGQVIDVFTPVSATELNDYTLELNSEKYAGTHTIYAVYGGVKYTDSSYGTTTYYLPATSNTVTLNVNNKQTIILLNPDSLTIKNGDGEEITPTLSEDIVTGNITYYDGENPIEGYIEVPLTTVFNTADLAIGIHNIAVKYNGAKGYDASEKSNTVKITVKGDKTAKVEVTNADYPNEVTIKVTSEIPGEYTVNINNTPVTVTVAKGATYGEATYKFAAGSYYANITSSPVSELYDIQTQNTTFNVNKAVNNVIVTVEDVTLPDGRVTVNVIADVAGTYVVKLNDTENTEITVVVAQPGVTASNSTTKKILSGKYSANTTFADDKNYTVTITNATFGVVKGEITVKVILDKAEFIYGENITGKVEISEDLPFTLKINDKEITVDNEGKFNAGILDVNSYTANVTFAGSDDYNKNSDKQDFTVVKATNNVKVEVTATNFKENVTVKVTADVDGLYSVDINGTTVNVLVSGGSGENKTKLKAGSYYANTTFANNNYEVNIINTTFTVLKLENNIKISIDDTVLPNQVKVNVTADVDDEYIITIGDQTVNVKVEHGKGSNTIKLANGTYTATTEFTNENYTAVITDANFKVSKGEITLQIIIPQTVIYSNNVTGTVTASVDGKYYVKIGENEAIEVNVNGNVGNFNVGKLPVTKYNATVTFNGDDDYNKNSNKTSFEVTPSGTDFKAYANESVITYGENIKLIHELPADASGTVTYTYINGTPIDTVNAHDEYELIKPESGSHVIIAEYSGDSNYDGIATQFSFKVDPAINKITVEVTATNFKENVTVKVTADVDGLYSVDINDTTVNVLVSGGSGENKTKLKAGSYYANVTYNDKNYIGDITNDTFNVETLNNNINIIINKTNTLPGEVTVNVTADVDDTYIVNIGGVKVDVEVTGGKGSNTVSLPAGENYNATTAWINENYTVNINNAIFDVVKGEITVKVTLDKDEFTYGENVTGKIEISENLPFTLKINDKVVAVNDDGSFDAGVLAADSYAANVTFDGSDDYKANSDKRDFTVKQAVNNIKVIVNRTNVLPGEVTVNVTADVDDTYSVDIGGTIVLVDVVKGKGNNTVVLPAGENYHANITWVNDNYTAVITNATFDVVKGEIKVKVTLDKSKFIYGENVTGKVEISEDLPFTLKINDKIITVNSDGSFDAGVLAADLYVANVTFDGSDDYKANSDKQEFTVNKAVNNIVVNVDDVTLPDGKVIVKVKADIVGTYTVKLNDTANTEVTVVITQANTETEATTNPVLPAGKYSANTTFADDKNYTVAITNDTFDVVKGEITVKVILDKDEFVYGENVTGKVEISQDLPVILKINDKIVIVAGDGSFDAGVLAADSYVANVTFEGSDDYKANSDKQDFTVKQATNNIKVIVEKTVLPNLVTVNVTADVDGTYSVDVGGVNVTVDVVKGKGNNTVALPAGENYNANIAWTNNNYTVVITNATFDVVKGEITVKVILDKDEFLYGENVTGEVEISEDLPFTLKINDKVISVGDDGKFNAGVLAADSYVANVTFDGSDDYNANSDKQDFTVKQAVNNIVVIVNRTNVLPGEVTVNVTADVDGTYSVDVGGVTVTVDVVKGKGNNTVVLPAGENYHANITWVNDNYTAVITNATFDVVKGKNNVIVETDGSTYPNNVTIKVTADIAGKYNLKLTDDITWEVEIPENGASKEITYKLPADDYTASIVNYVNETYELISTPTDFKVNPGKNNIVISANKTNTLSNTILINVTADVDDTYIIDINGTPVSVEVIGGNGSATVSLSAGENYNATTSWSNSNYTSEVTNALFDVVKGEITVKVILDKDEFVYGENVTGKVEISEDLPFTLKINNQTVTVDSEGKFNAGVLAADTYVINATFDGNDNYTGNSDKQEFTVTKATNNIIVTVDKTNVLPGEVTFNVTADVDDTYSVDIGGAIVLVDVVKGKGNNSVVLPAGENYRANIAWSNENYTAVITNATFDVVKGEITVKVTPDKDEFTYGENITGKVEISKDLPFTLKINNQTVTVDSEGRFNAGALEVNTYLANVTFEGSDDYNANSNKTEFNVKKATNNIKVIVEDTILPNQVTVKVTADVDDAYIVNINGTEVSVKVENKSGVNTTALKAGNYEANVNYANSNYDANITKAVFSVLKAKAELTISANASEITEGEAIKLSYELSQNATGEVKFYDNGELITDINNIVLTVGNHNITAKYDGDDNYDATSDEITVKVAEKINNINLNITSATYPENITVKLTADEDGTYIVKINDTEIPVTVVNGSGEASVNLPAGNYTAKLGNQSVDFTVSAKDKLTPELKSVFNDTVLTVEVPGDADGNVTVKLGDNTYTAEISDGKAVFNLSDLTGGNYTAQITYSGDDQYNSNTATADINIPVKETKNNINLSVESVKLPENITVTVKADNDGNYTVDINGIDVNVEVKNHTGTASINLPAGNYTAKLGNQSVDFTVSAKDKLTPELKSVFNDTVLTVEVPGDADGNVTVKLGDNTYTAEIRDGKAVFNLSDLTSGNYTAQITYSGDENYINATDSVKITIPAREETPEKTNAQMNVTVPNTITVGDDATIDIKLSDNATGNITVLLDGKQLANAEIINGTISIPVNTVSPGVYVVEIRYSGDDKYNETTQLAAMLVNDKIPVKKDTIITANATLTRTANEHYKTGENGTDYYVTLTDTDGNPLANKTVQMAINGVIYEIQTDINGQAHQIINMESANVYTYAFSFQGDDEYNAAPLTSTRLTVTKKATTITAKAASFKKSAKTKKLTVTLKTVKNADGKTYLAKGKKITLKVNGKTYTGKTNAKNQVTFNLKLTKKGKFTAKIRFAGSKIYAASSKSVKITIR